MEQNDMQVFNFEGGKRTRIVMKDGVPWWVGTDVCDILGYANAPDAIDKHCKHKEIMTIAKRDSQKGGARFLSIIPESDVYRLIIRSNMPEAERFETWVMEEVLPSIRKHGAYKTPLKTEKTTVNPEIIMPIIEALRKEQERVKELEENAKKLFKDYERIISSGIQVQDAFNNHEIGIFGHFTSIERQGELIIARIGNKENCHGLMGLTTKLEIDDESTYHLIYDSEEAILHEHSN